jgi:hypothetical protein
MLALDRLVLIFKLEVFARQVYNVVGVSVLLSNAIPVNPTGHAIFRWRKSQYCMKIHLVKRL